MAFTRYCFTLQLLFRNQSVPAHTCTARTIAILLHVFCARYDASTRPPPFYAIHYTILVIAISCRGQLTMFVVFFLRPSALRRDTPSRRCSESTAASCRCELTRRIRKLCVPHGGLSGTRAAAGRRLRQALGSRRRLPPKAPRYIQESSP